MGNRVWDLSTIGEHLRVLGTLGPEWKPIDQCLLPGVMDPSGGSVDL